MLEEIKKLKDINVDLKKLINNDDYLCKFLISEIKDLEERIINNKFINFTVFQRGLHT